MRINHSQDRYGMYSSILSIKVRIKAEPNLLANATSYRDTLDHNPASTEQKVNKNSREIPTKFFRVRHDDITEKKCVEFVQSIHFLSTMYKSYVPVTERGC